MNGQAIIDEFNVITDNQSDLSSDSLLSLLNKVYRKVLQDRDWLFLVSTETGTLSTSTRITTLPTDFVKLVNNYKDQDDEFPVLYVGDNYEVYHPIQQGERRQYRDSKGYFYVDYKAKTFVLTGDEDSARSYEFDYIYEPDDLTLITEPVIPFNHKYLAHGMSFLWNDIDGTEKSFSYRAENKREFEDGLASLQYDDLKKRGNNNR